MSSVFKDTRYFKVQPEVEFCKPGNIKKPLPKLSSRTVLQTKYSQAIADHGMTIWEQSPDDISITSDYFSEEGIVEQFINTEEPSPVTVFREAVKSPVFSPRSDATTASLHDGQVSPNSDWSTSADDQNSPGLQQREPSFELISHSHDESEFFIPREISSAQLSPKSQSSTPSSSRQHKKVTWAKDTIYNDGETVPEIFMTSTPENLDILDAVPALSEVEWSAWWWGPWVAKTIFSLSNSFPVPGGNFQNVDLPDGGQLNLDWYCDSQPKENGTVLILPGLNVQSRCYHIWKLATKLQDQGFNVVAMNYRGVSQPLKSARLGYADSWLDFPYALRKIGERICCKDNSSRTICENYEPDFLEMCHENMQCEKDIENMKFYAVGTSMGAMLLSRFSVEQDNREHSVLFKHMPAIPTISGQVLISGPLHMKRLVHEFYESSYLGAVWSFVFALMCKIITFSAHWRNKHWYTILFKIGLWNFISSLNVHSLSDVFAGAHGWYSGTEYWEQCSSGDHVGRHENSPNTLCIISKQDVIVPRSVAKPRDPLPKKVIYVESHGGAHLAFGSRHMGWVNRAICDYFNHLSAMDSKTN